MTSTWGDVPPRNPDFTGREDLLALLRSRLTTPTMAEPVVLLGTGETGKTQIAVEYIHRYAHEYDLVWWIPAGNGDVRTSLVALARRLGLTGDDESAVLRELDSGVRGGRWLLVFDDADSPMSVRRFLPAGGGHVVVTSRNPLWGYAASTITVARVLAPDGHRHPDGTYVICVFDLERFGAGNRTQQNRMAIRQGMYTIVEAAFARAGIPWHTSYRRDTGDGVLVAVRAAGTNKNAFVGELLTALTELLDEHNRTRPEEVVRVRLALHVGEIAFDSRGPDGPGFIHVTRLLEAGPLKSELARSARPLAVITSAYVYDEVVKQHARHAPEAYRRVTVLVKETAAYGWIRLPGGRLPASALGRFGWKVRDSVREIVNNVGNKVTPGKR